MALELRPPCLPAPANQTSRGAGSSAPKSLASAQTQPEERCNEDGGQRELRTLCSASVEYALIAIVMVTTPSRVALLERQRGVGAAAGESVVEQRAVRDTQEIGGGEGGKGRRAGQSRCIMHRAQRAARGSRRWLLASDRRGRGRADGGEGRAGLL